MPWAILIGAVFFIGTGGLLYAALRRRYLYTMHTSQLLFICAAVWAYLLLCHAIPSLFQALSSTGSSSTKDVSRVAPPSVATTVMTPTLPPGDATAAVLTQRH